MITVHELTSRAGFELINREKHENREITSVYCCDLLSMVMGRAPAGSAWITIMGNVNAVAVSALADTACVIVADGAGVEDRALLKADEQGVMILRSDRPAFETAKLVDSLIAGAQQERESA